MANNIPITPGSGAVVATDDVSGIEYQKIKLDVGAAGVSAPVVQGGAAGIPVDILSGPGAQNFFTVAPKAATTFPVSAASALPVSDNGASFTVDAPVATPVFVRLSDGTNPIATLPVSGTATANQGTAAANSGAWPAKISDGTSSVGITDVSGAKALKVDVIQSVGSGGGLADEAAFTAGSTTVGLAAGVYNDSVAAPSSGQAAAIRSTPNRALHINIRKQDGTELATSGAPIRVDPTGGTTQPVSGTVQANIKDGTGTVFSAGNPLPISGPVTASIKDGSGNPLTSTNPLPVQITGEALTRITKNVALTASQTGVALWTPTSSNKIFVTKVIIAVTVAGTLTIYSASNAAANILFDGTQSTGNREYGFTFPAWRTTSGGDVIKYDSGTGLVAQITIHGYETA
jgi:hypothetical protein